MTLMCPFLDVVDNALCSWIKTSAPASRSTSVTFSPFLRADALKPTLHIDLIVELVQG